MKTVIRVIVLFGLTFAFVTSSTANEQDNTQALAKKRISIIDFNSQHVVPVGNVSTLPQREKRFIITAIAAAVSIGTGIAKGIANVVLSSKQAALAREAAEQQARQFKEQNELKLRQLCNSICVTEWSTWSFCTKPCGKGKTYRTRKLQTIGACNNLKIFQCPYKNQLSENTFCNVGCPNGGAIADDGCACRKGYKGQCCQEESLCSYPGRPRSGSIKAPPSGFPGNYLEVIYYKCNKGYTLIGEEYAICQANGTWSRHPPRCQMIKCYPEGPRKKVHLLNSKPEFYHGQSLYYDCASGYKLVGSKSRMCQADLEGNGMWSGFNPLCEAIKCDAPKIPLHGESVGSDYRFGKRVKFSCNKGFTLIGSEVITCSDSGQWIGNIPKCEQIVCEAPYVPKHGEIKIFKKIFGSRAIYSCLPGYILKGPSVIYCEDGGMWNDTEPSCKAAKCKDPGYPTNGFKDGIVFHYPHNVTYGCFKGFELVGKQEISCLERGVWSGPKPQCKPCGYGRYMESDSCKDCPEHSNTSTTSSTSRHQCLCNGGYAGAPGGPCEEINCAKLGTPPFGQISGCDTKLGSECQFTCDVGFILEKGSSERVCRDKGDWDGSNPVCSPCPLNTYQSSEAQCTPCPENSHTEDVGQTLEGCKCNVGFQGPPGGPCKDVNECLANDGKGPCEDTCENSVGSYTCRCSVPGYVLDEDGHTCRVEKQCKNLTEHDAPAHGGLVCHWFTRHNSQQCMAKCNPGYDFPTRINNYELCGPNTGFQWSFKREDPTAIIEPCIEEHFPEIRLEAESNYFVRRCKDLTDDEQKAVKEQFSDVLNKEDICKDRRKNPICQIKDIAIICGRTTRRRRRRGVLEMQSSIDFAFNVTLFQVDISTEECPDICKRFRIPSRHCEKYCVPVYKKYLKKAVTVAKLKLSKAFKTTHKKSMNFVAAQRYFEAEGSVTSDVKVECDPGMKSQKQLCIPCLPGTYYSPKINECVPCANGTYQPLYSQEKCFTCPVGTHSPKPGGVSCFVCYNNTWGPQCQNECDCKSGVCNQVDGSCFCSSGWQGKRCDEDIPGCLEGRCFPGVKCTDVPAPGTGFSCGPCPIGYHGNGRTCYIMNLTKTSSWS